jgi:hypothetical protein
VRSRRTQGNLELWLEVLTVADASAIPPLPLSPPQPEKWELRVVIWETRKCTMRDTVLPPVPAAPSRTAC